jgi:hypothetical protein
MDGLEIAPLRNMLSQHCLPHMNDVLERAQAMTEDHRSVYELLSRVARLFSRSEPEELERVFRALTLDRRITSQMLPYRKLAQLRRAGILVSTNHGVYGYCARIRCGLPHSPLSRYGLPKNDCPSGRSGGGGEP